MSALVLSPHLDDAVLSCWHVLSSSADVVVLNAFSPRTVSSTLCERGSRTTRP